MWCCVRSDPVFEYKGILCKNKKKKNMLACIKKKNIIKRIKKGILDFSILLLKYPSFLNI